MVFLAVFGNVKELVLLAHRLNAYTILNFQLISIALRLLIIIPQS